MRGPDVEHPFLLIPGPTELHPDVAAATVRPMIGHRGAIIRELLDDVLGRVQTLLHTEGAVLPLACSATGAMEASIRNVGEGPFLHLVGGGFGKRWSKVRSACGFEGDDLEVEWGEPVRGDELAAALERRPYTAVTIVHSETSTGVLQPLSELCEVARRVRPEALILVDTVTSMAAVELDLDRWGVDVCFAGSQKAWGLPPGLTLCTVSVRALRRSEDARAKGLYFDFVDHVEAYRRRETPSTPPVSLLFGLRAVLDRIDEEGPRARYERHEALARRVEDWALGRFRIFPRRGFRSPSLSVLEVDGIDVASTLEAMRARGWWLGAGYGRTRESCLRIGHMGELDPETLGRALDDLDQSLVPVATGA